MLDLSFFKKKNITSDEKDIKNKSLYGKDYILKEIEKNPIGVLGYLYRSFIPVSDRFYIMDLIGRLSPEDRLRLEKVFIRNENIVEKALIRSDKLDNAVKNGEVGIVWEDFSLSMLTEESLVSSLKESSLFKISNKGFGKSAKDEQKIRFIKKNLNKNKSLSQELWNTIDALVEKGHALFLPQAKEVFFGNPTEVSTDKLLDHVISYLYEDQSEIMRAAAYSVKDGSTQIILDLEEKIDRYHRNERLSDVLKFRLEELDYLNAFAQTDELKEYAHVFRYSLILYLDALAAKEIENMKHYTQSAWDYIKRVSRIVLELPTYTNEPAEYRALKQSLKSIVNYQASFLHGVGSFKEKQEEFGNMALLCNLLFKSLTERKIVLDHKMFQKEDIKKLEDVLDAFIIAYRFILPYLKAELKREAEGDKENWKIRAISVFDDLLRQTQFS